MKIYLYKVFVKSVREYTTESKKSICGPVDKYNVQDAVELTVDSKVITPAVSAT